MEKIGILSDIHGNLEALKEALFYLENENIDSLISLGDVIGYGIDGAECYHALNQYKTIFIMGNHEAMYLEEISDENCSSIGKLSSNWQKKHIDKSVLPKDLKLYHEHKGVIFCHSVPKKRGYLLYLNKLEELLESFKETADIVFYGHTHRPRITKVSSEKVEDIFVYESTSIRIENEKKYYFNIGSVGQQRDTKTDMSFAICVFDDISLKTVDIYRKNYNCFETFCKIMNYPELENIANYLIREEEKRRKYHELLNHRG